jgi:hypothetical protein
VDGFHAGPGDDLVDSADGRAEFVDCGPGEDTAIADGVDVLVGCERGSLTGPRLPVAVAAAGFRGRRVRVPFRVPRTDAYELLAGGPCDAAMGVLASVRAHAGAHVTLAARPRCRGAYAGLIARAPACPPGRRCLLPRPIEPVALVTFRLR